MHGQVNIPAKTAAEVVDGIIYVNNLPVCYVTSENAHQYFARDDDGNGMERGWLTQEIQRLLRGHQDRWDRVWADPVCRAYKRPEHEDYWLWNHEFFNSDIETLRYIHRLVK